MSKDIELQRVDQEEHDFLKNKFNLYDTNEDGVLQLTELQNLLKTEDPSNRKWPKYVVNKILNISDEDGNGVLDFEEFCKMWEHPDLKSILQHHLNSYVRLVIPKSLNPGVEERESGEYEDEYSCCPPSLAMFITTIIIVVLFIVDEALMTDDFMTNHGPIANSLIFKPKEKQEAWRYISYMFVHVGYMHLVVNCCIQLILGIPLEMVHGWWRVLLTYLSGVIAGSLISAITDPNTDMAGASGGVYALITAQIANIIMNWAEMTFPLNLFHLLFYLIITVSDLGSAIYNRYNSSNDEHVAYMAHLAGAVSGLLVGVQILKNLNTTKKEKYIWWACLISYVILTGIGVILNICNVSII